MADTLKEFSSFTNKSYSDLKDGITIASTNGSQKAVIKHISIDNPNGRNIQIRQGSATGPIVAQTTSDGLNGNEILDNSQSLVATTDESLPITNIHQVGWYEGHHGNEYLTTGHIRTWGTKGQKGRDHNWTTQDLDWGPTNENEVTSTNDSAYGRRFFNSAATGQSLKAVSDSWFGADGRFYWVHRQGGGAIGSTSLSNFTVRRFETDSTTVTTYGSDDAYVSAYDGERYFYCIANNSSTMRRYDTKTLGTSNTYTSITLLPPDKDTGTQAIGFHPSVAGYYYNDGYILVNGSNSNDENDSGSFRLISCTTGKTKTCLSPGWDNHNSFGTGTATSTHRSSLGLVRDSQGDYWTFIGRYGNDSGHTEDANRMYICCLGNDPENTFLANGLHFGRQRIWRIGYNQSDSKWIQTLESQHSYNITRKMGANGDYFGNPAGLAVHSPGMKRYLILCGTHYKDGTQCQDNDRGPWFVVLDFDKWNSMEGFVPDMFRGNGMRYNNGDGNRPRYRAGVYRMVSSPEGVDGYFGNISIRTTGILVT